MWSGAGVLSWTSGWMWFCAVIGLLISESTACRDENNNLVDWFVIYKIPELKYHSNSLVKSGSAYAYMLPDNDKAWILSEKSINDSKSIPGLTLASLYEHSANSIVEDALYILYNDQPPVGNVSFTGGHTKGVVRGGKTGGFWLVHSVPHYPPLPTQHGYSYPSTGLRNGQSYLCVTLSPAQLDLVGVQLMYNDPHVFASSTPEHLRSQYPTLTKAAQGDDVVSPPWYHSQLLVSAAGSSFFTFAKTPQFNKDLYSDWVATALKTSLFVETWPNGVGHLNSSCLHPYRVENVEEVRLPVVGEVFSAHKDHSKWAVSESKANPWVCVGDINRATTQAVRGGGTVCLRNLLLWQAYNTSVVNVERCQH